MTSFTPWSALAGGALIGIGASVLWWTLGRLAGVSNILGRAIEVRGADGAWRWAFLFGLLVAGFAGQFVLGDRLQFDLAANYGQLAIAGVLVGVGTQMGGGCTSGHGVCGVSRLSPRSLVATLCFMLTGMLAVFFWVR
jgi:uncharacterized membrane protein YedE/YeeE